MFERLDRRMSVLVVEDDQPTRCLISEALTDRGYHALEADSGERALLLACSACEDLVAVVVDVVLPGSMTGPVLVSELREIVPLVRVIFISGYSEAVVRTSGVMGGDVHFLAKPFKIRKLLELIEKDLCD